MADDSKHGGHESKDDISSLMYVVGALLLVSMIIAYFVSF